MKKKAQLMGFMIIALLATSLFAGCIEEEPKEELKERGEGKSLPKEWKGYESKEWGFRIKYPAEKKFLIICWEPYSVDPSETQLKKAKTARFAFRYLGGIFDLVIYREPSTEAEQKKEKWLEEDLATIQKRYEKEGKELEVLEIKKVTLDGQPALRGVWQVKGEEEVKMIEICCFLRSKGYMYVICFPEYQGPVSKYNKMHEEMLDSFKFIEVEK
jgi:hypothetical protein